LSTLADWGAKGTSNRKFRRSSSTHSGTSPLRQWCWHEQPAIATLRLPAQCTRIPLGAWRSKMQEGEKVSSKPFVGTACVQTCEDERMEGRNKNKHKEK